MCFRRTSQSMEAGFAARDDAKLFAAADGLLRGPPLSSNVSWMRGAEDVEIVDYH